MHLIKKYMVPSFDQAQKCVKSADAYGAIINASLMNSTQLRAFLLLFSAASPFLSAPLFLFSLRPSPRNVPRIWGSVLASGAHPALHGSVPPPGPEPLRRCRLLLEPRPRGRAQSLTQLNRPAQERRVCQVRHDRNWVRYDVLKT